MSGKHLLLIFGLIYNSCTNKVPEEVEQPITLGLSPIQGTLTIVDTLKIKVDSLTDPNHYHDQLKFINNEPYYFIYNKTFSRLQVYNLYDSTKNQLIDFVAEGPDGIGEPDRFYFHNIDSIFFIYGDSYKQVALYNSGGTMVNKWDIIFPEPFEDYWISNELFYTFEYDPLTESVGFWMSRGLVTTLDYQRSVLQCRFNLHTRKYRVFGEYPHEFYQTIYYPNNDVNGYSTKKYFVSYYMPSHEVHLYSRQTLSLTKRLKIKSQYVPEYFNPFITSDDEERGMQEEMDYNVEHAFYVKMITNENNSLNYRIAKLATPLKYPDGKRRLFFDMPFSIMVLDEEFKLIQEQMFPGGKYDFFQSFAYGDKVFLSLNNRVSNYASDDYMQFSVFQLKQGD